MVTRPARKKVKALTSRKAGDEADAVFSVGFPSLLLLTNGIPCPCWLTGTAKNHRAQFPSFLWSASPPLSASERIHTELQNTTTEMPYGRRVATSIFVGSLINVLRWGSAASTSCVDVRTTLTFSCRPISTFVFQVPCGCQDHIERTSGSRRESSFHQGL
ncbi:hypothetical protein F5X98DRAFT_40726 [Xylaria grammica]|nr:hypothetical protein F5X98DRAFT_40726 [Xylaria grammica]